MHGKELYSADETAAILKISKRTLLRWAREERIERVKISAKVVLFAAEAIDDFLQTKTIRVESQAPRHQRAGRKIKSPETKKGGEKNRSGELWKDLRKEVRQWQ